MNELEQHFKKHTENIRMTSAEKNAMRFRIQEQMGSPELTAKRVSSPYVWLFAPRMIAAFGVLLLVIVSTGSAYAAEGALPGAPLYPVKTNILEPLTVALAPTTQAKAQANADIAATRVQEAQALAAQGMLTSAAVQEISTNYNQHAQAALALAADVDAQNGEDGAATTSDATETEGDGGVMTVATAVPAGVSASTSSGTIVAVQVPPIVPATLSVHIETDSSSDDEGEASTSDSDSRVRTAMTFSEHETSSASATPTLSKKTFTPSAAIAIHASSTATTTSRSASSFVRTLRASLSAQAEILRQLDAQVRVGRSEKSDN